LPAASPPKPCLISEAKCASEKPRWQIVANHGMILHALERSEKRSPRAVKINQHAAAIIP